MYSMVKYIWILCIPGPEKMWHANITNYTLNGHWLMLAYFPLDAATYKTKLTNSYTIKRKIFHYWFKELLFTQKSWSIIECAAYVAYLKACIATFIYMY